MRNKVAYLGVFLALALVLSYVESLIPFYFGIPGVKLGLTNLVVVFMLYCVGTWEAFTISALRIVLAGFLFGNMFSILYSLAGAALSLAVMTFMQKKSGFTVMGISVSGGVFHNIGQLAVAALIVENFGVLYYAPVLLVSGVITGLLIGFLTQEVLKRVRL